MNHIAVGVAGEQRAVRYLTRLGYKPVAVNTRVGRDELDVIMRDGKSLVFVEVKTRRTLGGGLPQEAVTPTKLRHITRAAERYCADSRYVGPWRVDVLAILGDQITHLKNITR